MDPDKWTPHRKALVVGATAGSVTSLGAIIAYFVVPLASEEYTYGVDGMEATSAVLEGFAVQSTVTHAVILFVTPLVTTIGAVLFARQWGLTEWETDMTIIGSVLIVPVLTVWGAMSVAVVLIGITNHPVFVPYALIFGIPITIIVSGIVAGVEFIGIASGYALVVGGERVRTQ
jgi:hypothetical protein